jgi:cell division protein FtsN
MAKAKSKKKNVSRNSKSSAKGGTPGWVKFLVFVAIVSALIFLAYLKFHQEKSPNPAESPAEENAKITTDAPKKEDKKSQSKQGIANSPAEKTNDQEEPRFDFYTLLPSQTVMSDGKPNVLNNPRPITRYALQAGAFKSQDEADKRRAELLMQGFKVIIQPAKTNDPLYRVLIGPFDKKEGAEEARKSLTSNGIETFLLKQ